MRRWLLLPSLALASFSCFEAAAGEENKNSAPLQEQRKSSGSTSPSVLNQTSDPIKRSQTLDASRDDSSRGSLVNQRSQERFDSELLGQAAPGSTGLNDLDLSQQRRSSSSAKSLSQFASSNRSSSAFRTTNIFGDFFGGKNGINRFVIPVTLKDLESGDNGHGVFTFTIRGDNVPAFTSIGTADPKGDFEVSAPDPNSSAYTPAGDGLKGFFFGGGKAIAIPPGTVGTLADAPFDVTYFFDSNAVLPANTTALYGRQKIAENVSPIPRNRIFLNYSYFDDTPLAGGLDVKRWAPGFESLVGSELSSIEVRLPLATTMSSDIFDQGTDFTHVEVGNLYFALKHLIYQDDQLAISAGCSFTVPTADDINVFIRSSTFGNRKILQIENETFHVLPFVGWFKNYGHAFTQGFCQIDIDTNGNSVNYNSNILQDGLTPLGRVHDANFWYLDVQSGYWLYQAQAKQARKGLTGIATIAELHWNRSLNDEDNIAFPNGMSFFAPRTDVQILNGLVGLNFIYDLHTSISLGYAMPIGNGVDQEFNGEGRFILNRYF